jgi:hypothetical protein
LRDGRGGLGGSAIAFHLDRPCFGLGAVGLTYGLGSALAHAIRTYLRASDLNYGDSAGLHPLSETR